MFVAFMLLHKFYFVLMYALRFLFLRLEPFKFDLNHI
jgi:hypothetical protein